MINPYHSFTKLLLLLFINLLSFSAHSQHVDLKLINTNVDASFRGLSVVDDQVAWVSGSKGYVGKTDDGGVTWAFQQISGYDTLDFRSIYAFDESNAVVANAGSPANILFTSDGGANWTNVYRNTNKSAFIDGVDFFNEREGIMYGDPIEKRMLLLRTTDGGRTWEEFPLESRPILEDGEASFAASGTNIRCRNGNEITIATGGIFSRIWSSRNKGKSSTSTNTPIIQGKNSTGIFSFTAKGLHDIYIVGGDYLQDTLTQDHVFYSADGGKSWVAPQTPTRGYRECVEYVSQDVLVALGPSGIDATSDGKTWRAVSDEKYFHVIRKARKGKAVVLAGGKGKIAILKLEER